MTAMLVPQLEGTTERESEQPSTHKNLKYNTHLLQTHALQHTSNVFILP